jgi:hypothetical protein
MARVVERDARAVAELLIQTAPAVVGVHRCVGGAVAPGTVRVIVRGRVARRDVCDRRVGPGVDQRAVGAGVPSVEVRGPGEVAGRTVVVAAARRTTRSSTTRVTRVPVAPQTL